MRTRSSSNLPGESPLNLSSSNPKRHNRRRSKQPFLLEESPVDTTADQRTMAELLRAPTEGYAEAIVVPSILSEQFELKHSLINMMTSDQFFELEKDNPHDHIRWSIPSVACDRYKDLLRACTHYDFTELHQLDTFYNALNPADQDSLNSATGGNLLERRTQDGLTIIENKSKVRNSRNKLIVSQVKSSDANSSSSYEIAKLTHAVNQQTSVVTTVMTAILKQFQATPPPASVKSVKEICVTCGGAYPYYQCLAASGNTFPELQDNIQGYVAAAAVNYNQGNFGYRPLGVANQIQPPVVPLSELEKIKRINKANMKAMQTQINNVKNELRNEMKNLIQASMSNQTNELKNMMASFFQMNTASTSGSRLLPSNNIDNPKGELKAITTRSGIVLDGPSVPIPSPFINPEEDERIEETLTDQDLAEYTIKVPPPLVQKPKPPSQRNFVVHQRDPIHPNIPYPSRMHKQKQQEKDEVQIHKFSLLSNKEKLLEMANTPLNENCSAVILKKLPEKLRDLRNFSFRVPSAICTPAGIARDVFVPVGKFTFPANLVIVDYESDPRVPLILGRPFLRTAHALIDVHREQMILRDEIEYLLNNDPIKEMDSNLEDSIDEDNLADLNDNLADTMPEMFTDKHAFDYSSPLLYDEYDNDLFEVESDTEYVYDDPFESKGEKIKESKLLIDELDLPRSSDFLPSPEYDSFLFEDFPRNSWILKSHAGYCPSVFTSSASIRNHISKSNRLTSIFWHTI
uniref:Reverse transcriptase domain-containing protein n=1 Tax=Tanacetum cinerariifolium TaxID=118510 RepID=A0A699I4B6_TANCI|nr:hypothetical protein [Tanacetum cinerariifolium]GEZ14424.1 hypothetical protein [Tanacetum cinerariifolium]